VAWIVGKRDRYCSRKLPGKLWKEEAGHYLSHHEAG
jgi:hypothetical protein